jgi:phosphate transport system ATP-binding protein
MSDPAIKIKGVSCFYGAAQALFNADIEIPENCVYAFIGPSGCGKTTLLRSLNRLNDLIKGFRLEGKVEIDGRDIYALRERRGVEKLRQGIGMIFQQPNPLPASVLKNMCMPLKEHYHISERELRERAEEKLQAAGLYGEVSGRLKKAAMSLSGGQQQRLCIARALMLEPKIMLMDEPCSALDPTATMKIEDMLAGLKRERTIVIVTHNLEQARRIADYTAFFYKGKIIEAGPTGDIFSKPKEELTDRYIRGIF